MSIWFFIEKMFFSHYVNHLLKNRGSNWTIFGPFSDFREFLKNWELMFETSDFDFCDLLDEFFQMAEKHIFEKIKFSKVILKSLILVCYSKIYTSKIQVSYFVKGVLFIMRLIWNNQLLYRISHLQCILYVIYII